MKILSIETSCDETGIALVEASGGLYAPKFKVLKNLVSSQIKIHRPFGGVVPGLAKREHIKNLPLLWQRIMNNELRIKGKKSIIHNSQFTIQDIDLIAVTVGPGLEPALWAGITFAQSLTNDDFTLTNPEAEQARYGAGAEKGLRGSAPAPTPKFGVGVNLRKSAKPKLVGVNHLEGHLYSFLLPRQKKTGISNSQFLISSARGGSALGGKQAPNSKSKTIKFPAIALLVSGGHTTLLLMKDLKTWKRLGETKDDAAGEAFDKVARMLNLPYPGGPEIEKLALRQAQGKHPKGTINFPRPMLNQKNYDFSFSGLKTSVFYFLREQKIEGIMNNELRIKGKKSIIHNSQFTIQDVAASFQRAVIDVLVAKTMRAAGEYGARSVILCGGVAANKTLREDMRKAVHEIGAKFFVPETEYNNDNAAMIAAAGYFAFLRRKKLPLRANGDLNI